MSNISDGVQKEIDIIDELAAGSVDNQISACKDHLCTNFYDDGCLADGIDKSVNAIFLPFIIKCTESDNAVLQLEGAFFLDAICSTRNYEKEQTKLVIEAGAIPKLVHNLSSATDSLALDQTLKCLGKIAARYPRNVINKNILPSLNECLKSTDRKVFYQAVKCFAILSTTCQEKVLDIIGFNSIDSLLKHVEADTNGTISGRRYSLVSLLSSSASNDHDALKSLKDVFEWLLAEKAVAMKDQALHKSNERKIIKLLAIKFIKNVISLGEAAVDAIFREDFISPILQNINAPSTFKEIKPKCIKLIEDIISVKHGSVETLVKDYDIISLLCNNLGSSTNDLLVIRALTVLKKIVLMFDNEEDKELCCQKIRDCDVDLKKLTKLRKDINRTIKELSTFIYNFVNNASTAEDSADSQNDANDSPAAAAFERPRTRRHPPKRQANPPASEKPSTRSKRSRISSEQANTEQSTSVDEEENDEIDMDQDIDDYPESFGNNDTTHLAATVPLVQVPSTNISTQDNLSGHNPSVHLGTTAAVTATGTIQNSLNSAEPLPPSDNSASSALDAFPVLPQPPSADTVTTTQIVNNFSTVNYRPISEEKLEEYCSLLGIQFNPEAYYTFFAKIKFRQIRPDSVPIRVHIPIDRSGAGCFSVFLTGDEHNAQKIRDKIDAKYNAELLQSDNLDREKLTNVINSTEMLPEHFETIAAWFTCRIMIYSYGTWKRYGNFDSTDDKTVLPLFVLAKREIKGKIKKTEYLIVLGFENV